MKLVSLKQTFLIGFTIIAALTFYSPALSQANSGKIRPHISSKLLKGYELLDKSILDKFVFTEDGFILNGPKSAPSEPVDYSALVKREKIHEVFIGSTLFCNQIQKHCYSPVKRLEKLNLKISIQDGAGIAKSVVAEKLQSSMSNASIEVSTETDNPNVHLYIGELDYLVLSARILNDEKAVSYYELLRDFYLGKNVPLWEKNDYRDCFVSRAFRHDGIDVAIYVARQNYSECLFPNILEAIGLHPTHGFFPTVTGTLGDERSIIYRELTEYDKWALTTLLREDFPISAGPHDLRQYLRKIDQE